MFNEMFTRYKTIGAAEDMQTRLTKSEEDGWSYKVAQHGQMHTIEVWDNEGNKLGYL